MREIWEKILQTGGTKIYSVFLGMLLIIVTARILGPEGRGELVTIITWVTTFSTFAYLSLGQVAVHKAAQTKGSSWFPTAYHVLLSFACILTIIAWLIALAIYISPIRHLFGDINPLWLLLGFLLLPFRIWEHYSSALLQSIERLDIQNRFLIIGGTIGFISTVCFLIILGLGVEGALFGSLLTQLIIAAGGLKLMHSMAGGWRFPDRLIMQDFLYNGLKLHMNAVGMFFITGADILMLNYYKGTEETAFYQLGVQLMGMIILIPQAANMVILGKVSTLGPNIAWSIHKKILIQVIILVICIALITGSTARWWIPLLLGEEFMPSVELFQWLLLASIGMTFSTIMASQWIGRGFFGTISILSLIFGTTNLLLNWLLIPHHGMYGALTATLVTYAISIMVNGAMIYYCNKQAKIYG